jgi:dipeptidyl aminopeptidase/acylaminoacyl peptidase
MSNSFGVKSIYNSPSRIAFTILRESFVNDIYTINPDGTDCVKIQPIGGQVAWSPNGQWIAFVSDETETPSIWITRPDGTSTTLVVHHASFTAYHPTWSPNSDEIAFDYYDYENCRTRICIVNLRSGQIRALTQYGFTTLQWLSTNEIIFKNESCEDVFIADSSGMRRCELLSDFNANHTESWFSSDGNKVATINDFKSICLIDRDGTNYKQFNFPNFHVCEVKWSPDNNCVIFLNRRIVEQYVEELWAMAIEEQSAWLVAKSTEYEIVSFSEESIKAYKAINYFSWSPFL